MLGAEVLRVDQVLAVVGGCSCRHVFLDPLQLAVGVEVVLMPAQRVLQLVTSLRHRVFECVEPATRDLWWTLTDSTQMFTLNHTLTQIHMCLSKQQNQPFIEVFYSFQDGVRIKMAGSGHLVALLNNAL